MGMRQPARLSTTHAYGVPEATLADAPSGASGFLPLLILVVGLAIATVWYVALPAFDEPVAKKRSCEVVVLASGSIKCVAKPMHRAQAVSHRTSARARR